MVFQKFSKNDIYSIKVNIKILKDYLTIWKSGKFYFMLNWIKKEEKYTNVINYKEREEKEKHEESLKSSEKLQISSI